MRPIPVPVARLWKSGEPALEGERDLPRREDEVFEAAEGGRDEALSVLPDVFLSLAPAVVLLLSSSCLLALPPE